MARKPIFFSIKKKLGRNGDSASLIFNKTMLSHLGAQVNSEIEIDLEEGKHGNFISIYCPKAQEAMKNGTKQKQELQSKPD